MTTLDTLAAKIKAAHNDAVATANKTLQHARETGQL
jgi:DNA-binding protein YbaB